MKYALFDIRSTLDANGDAMKDEVMGCLPCDSRWALEQLQCPRGTGPFLCPICGAVLQPNTRSSASAIRDDLSHFFTLLKDAEEADVEGPTERVTRHR